MRAKLQAAETQSRARHTAAENLCEIAVMLARARYPVNEGPPTIKQFRPKVLEFFGDVKHDTD